MLFRIILLTVIFILSACTTTSTSFTTPYSTQTETVSNEYDNQKAAATRVGIAYKYITNGEYERAKFHLDKALEYDPKSEQVMVGLAFYYQQVKRPKLAKTNYRKALALNPENPSTLNNYGIFLCEQGDYKESIEMFVKATEIFSNTDIPGTYENAGFCAAKDGDYDQASAFYRRALNYNSQQRLALLGMAEIEFLKERYQRTKSYLKRYEAASNPTPRSLWLAIRNAQKLNDLDGLVSYGIKLERLFPDSDETVLYLDNKPKWLR